MKKLVFTAMIGAMAVSAIAAGKKDPNAFADYGAAMASDKKSPMAVEWHNTNRNALETETSEDAIAAIVDSEEAAKVILAKVKPAYATDPMVAVQIAAVSQYVMTAEPSWWEFWNWFSDSPREIWTKALLDTAASATDTYVAQLCVDQLRWCAYPEQAADLCAIGKKAKCKALKQMIRMAVSEINPEFASENCAKCCKGGCPYGSWALTLPFDRMNAGHLILSKGADGKPAAKLLWRWGSPFDIPAADVKVEKGGFTFTFGNHKPKDLPQDKGAWRRDRVVAKVIGDWASCTYQKVDGNGKPVGAVQTFSARRNPKIGPAPDLKSAVRGEPINLLAGTIADFELMESNKENGWTLKDGVLSNRIQRDAKGKSLHKNGNLRTKRDDFYDFNLKYEVRVLPGCNSGVYLRGIYEIQVLDSYGKPVDCHNMAAYYGRVTPKVAAEKKAGEWQTVDVTLYKRHLTVVLNGVKIIDNVPVVGITGGAMTANEFVNGPLYIQGDHSDADFRNMVLTPLN
ncbi:MAG: DUF1080 domain-containing protein [Kiritimatiellae bacterium]|nr:DUF1080 domain-containing protein [Kiritimatiellia bacterium]